MATGGIYPFDSLCTTVKAVCSDGMTCEICPNGVKNPDDFHPDPYGDGDDHGDPKTCADAHELALIFNHDDNSCNSFKSFFADGGCLCNGGSKSAKTSKDSKSSKAPKASKS